MTGLVVTGWLLLTAEARAGAWRKLHAAAATGRVEVLTKGLRDDRSYLREVAARGLSRTAGSDAAREAALAHLADPAEAGLVRAWCAVALAQWKATDAVPVTIAAVDQVDGESRWWLAFALHAFDTPEARAELRELTADPDLFVAASAREWAP